MSVSFNDRIRLGQIGTVITITMTTVVNNADVPIDLTNVSNAFVDFRLPDNTIQSYPATILSPPSAGLIRFTDSTGIFNVRGRWQVRGRILYSGGNQFPGSFSGFPVEK